MSPAPTTSPPPTEATPDNPWSKNPVLVGIENDAGNAHHKYEIFRAALTYWETNAQRYAGAELEFEFAPDAPAPDILIEYVDRVEGCGEADVDVALGCAPIYTTGATDQPTVIQIRANDDDQQLLATTKHELGHVLGIEHGQAPMPLMAENNLYLHASPWKYPAIVVHVDYSDKPGVSEAVLEEEIRPALDYFEAGADSHLDSSPSFGRVDRASAANFVIVVHDSPQAETQFQGSIQQVYEGRIEGQTYRRVRVHLYDLDIEAISWHIAYQIAPYLLAHGEGSPDVLDPDECDYHCRRGKWWR